MKDAEAAANKTALEELTAIREAHANYKPCNRERLEELCVSHEQVMAQLEELQGKYGAFSGQNDTVNTRLDEATDRVAKLEDEKQLLEEELGRQKKKEEEATTRRGKLEDYVRMLDVQAAAEWEGREVWLREVAGIRPIERTQVGVRLSKETYNDWQLEVQSLKEQELLVEAEELPKARGTQG